MGTIQFDSASRCVENVFRDGQEEMAVANRGRQWPASAETTGQMNNKHNETKNYY